MKMCISRHDMKGKDDMRGKDVCFFLILHSSRGPAIVKLDIKGQCKCKEELKKNISGKLNYSKLGYLSQCTSYQSIATLSSEVSKKRPLFPVIYKQLVNSEPPGGVVPLYLHHCFAGRDFRNNIKYGEDIRLFV